MARRPSVEDRLAALSELREGADSVRVRVALAEALRDRSNHVVAKAARLVAELQHEELVADLVAAFDRLLDGGIKLDKTCAGKIALVEALLELQVPEVDVFLRGSRHVQLEPSFGPPVDAAAELRALCARGLAVSGPSEAILELVRLLADQEELVRQGAARALALSGRVEAEPLLRLKLLVGDEEPDVLGECFSSLLALEPERSLELVAEFLEHQDAAVAETAALALGSSRLDAALEVLRRPLEQGGTAAFDEDRRRTILGAISMLRRDDALDYLVAAVRNDPPERACAALGALSIHREDERLRRRVEDAVAEREDDGAAVERELRRIFA